MRIFILPSWCPSVDQPLAGTFFLEQAHAIAQLRPEWIVAFCQFDLARSRFPHRPGQVPRFVRDWFGTPPLVYEKARSGLYVYRVWAPYLPHFGLQGKWQANVRALAQQAKLALDDFIRRFGKPDLIHAHAVYPGGAAAVSLGREYGVPVGLTEHLGPFPPPTLCLPSGEMMPLLIDAYLGVSRCSAVSQPLADRINKLGLAHEIAVLPNFLPDNFGTNRSSLLKLHDGFSFLSVGGPTHAKGTDVLLKALSHIESNVTLSIVGESPELPIFKQMAVDLGLGGRVRWLGAVPRDQMPAQYLACDAFVLPSQSETFGIAFIEALAFGKPIIATRSGGPEDIVNKGNGLLVALNSVSELSEAMQYMVAHAGNYASDFLRADFLARFSATASVARLEAWYQSIAHYAQLNEVQ